MSTDARQSLIAWGAVVGMFCVFLLVLWLDIRLPDWLRDAYVGVMALLVAWRLLQGMRRSWVRRRA